MAEVADTCLTLADAEGSRRMVALRGLADTAVTDEQLSKLHDLAGDDVDLGWRRLTRLAALGRLDPAEVTALEHRDTDPEAWARAIAAQAARPEADAKRATWTAIVEESRLPLGTVFEAGQAFWQPGQDDVLAPFADRYLEALPAFSDKGMLSVITLVTAMFPVVAVDRSFADRVDGVASAGTVSPMIANRLLEQSDRLKRMLRARV
jgi:aminopeptidase N